MRVENAPNGPIVFKISHSVLLVARVATLKTGRVYLQNSLRESEFNFTLEFWPAPGQNVMSPYATVIRRIRLTIGTLQLLRIPFTKLESDLS